MSTRARVGLRWLVAAVAVLVSSGAWAGSSRIVGGDADVYCIIRMYRGAPALVEGLAGGASGSRVVDLHARVPSSERLREVIGAGTAPLELVNAQFGVGPGGESEPYLYEHRSVFAIHSERVRESDATRVSLGCAGGDGKLALVADRLEIGDGQALLASVVMNDRPYLLVLEFPALDAGRDGYARELATVQLDLRRDTASEVHEHVLDVRSRAIANLQQHDDGY